MVILALSASRRRQEFDSSKQVEHFLIFLIIKIVHLWPLHIINGSLQSYTV